MTTEHIAQRFNKPKSTIRRWVKEFNLPVLRHKPRGTFMVYEKTIVEVWLSHAAISQAKKKLKKAVVAFAAIKPEPWVIFWKPPKPTNIIIEDEGS